MKKLSQDQKLAVLAEVPEVLRKVAAERDIYRDELVKIASRHRVEKLAASMIDKGLETGSVDEVANHLEKSASEGELDLEVTEKAVEIAGPNMLQKSASVSDEASGGDTEFERYIVS